jgi:ubiquinol-cytochrome c reductase iron-sulfur subunit
LNEPTRRDFIFVTTAAVGAIGVGLVAWPLIDQMNPDASVLAFTSTDVDLSTVEIGASITVKWRGRPAFIRHRAAHEIEAARETGLDELIDGLARNPALPDDASATDENRAQRAEWLIAIGIRTHLGSVPLAYQGNYGGYFCPCHGSQYDTVGRVRVGPAPENLHVPSYSFLTDTQLRIG